MTFRGVVLASSLAAGLLGVGAWLWRPQAQATVAAPAAGSSLVASASTTSELEQAAAEHLADEPPAFEQPDPGHLLEAARKAVEALRPQDWDPDALAASLGKDPAAAFQFVRDAIAFDPYAGVLRGAAGTLAARAGNAWDRALLLRALLGDAGFTTRLAFGTLDPPTAAALVERAYQSPRHRLPEPGASEILVDLRAAIAARARRDDAALRLALADRLAQLGADDGDQPARDVARHAWVQLLQGGKWIDLDPTFPDAEIGMALTRAGAAADEVPKELRHVVIVRVVAETVTEGRLAETVSLERELDADVAAGTHLLLAFVPDTGRDGGLLGGTARPESFVPTLWALGEPQAGVPIMPMTAEGDGGLLDAFGGGAAATELVGLYVESETRVPGRRPRVARHVLLDRVRRKARSSASIATDGLKPAPKGGLRITGGFHHILVSTGGLGTLSMARWRSSALDSAFATEDDDEPASLPALASRLWPADLSLVEGSERLTVPALDTADGTRAYVDEPRVFMTSWLAERTPAGADGLARETDLLMDSIRVLAGPAAPSGSAGKQLYYGTLQSALETETALHMAAAWEPQGLTIASTSLAMGGRPTVLTPSDVEQLPGSAAGALERGLRAGDVAVVLGDVATATAWWSVAPTGFVRAVLDPGAGMSRIAGLGPRSAIGPAQGATKDMSGRGGKRQGGSGKGKGGGNEVINVQKVSGQVTRGGADTFSSSESARLARLAKLIGK